MFVDILSLFPVLRKRLNMSTLNLPDGRQANKTQLNNAIRLSEKKQPYSIELSEDFIVECGKTGDGLRIFSCYWLK